MTQPRFESREDASGNWRVVLVGSNGHVYPFFAVYATPSKAKRALASIQRAAKDAANIKPMASPEL